MGHGREAPPEKLQPFTFQDTGRTVQIRKVSTLIRAEVRRQIIADPKFAEPQPPLSDVDYGNGTIAVPNYAHPTYQQLMREWEGRVNRELGERLKNIIIRRAVVVDDLDTEEIARVRADLAAAGMSTEGLDDKHVYVAFICVGSEDDWGDLIKAVYTRSAPQEAAIKAHIDTFPGDVPGQEPVE